MKDCQRLLNPLSVAYHTKFRISDDVFILPLKESRRFSLTALKLKLVLVPSN
uniref:Uncharacterized protein n=1 Tax=Physcomitrium patens TaxID=3218 RepID=A0A2K1JCD8_PHYPA|nr:hypothetical protein PHYPA_019474 [Physcomitrium patens]